MMKWGRLFVIGISLLAVAGFGAAHIYIKANGKKIVVDGLQKIFDRDVYVRDVQYQFPASIRIDDLNVPGAFSVKRAVLKLGFPSWIPRRQVAFSEISLKEPQVTLEKNAGSAISWGWFSVSKYRGGTAGSVFGDSSRPQSPEPVQPSSPAAAPQNEGQKTRVSVSETIHDLFKSAGVYVERVRMMDASVSLIDYSYEPALTIKLDDIFLKMDRAVYPTRPMKTEIECAGVVTETGSFFKDGWFEMAGWMDLDQKDMDMDVKVLEPDGTISLRADLISRKNDMLVKGRMKVGGSAKGGEAPDAAQAASAEAFLKAMKLADIDMDVGFSFQTQMDNFHIGRVAIEGDIGLEGLGRISSLMK